MESLRGWGVPPREPYHDPAVTLDDETMVTTMKAICALIDDERERRKAAGRDLSVRLHPITFYQLAKDLHMRVDYADTVGLSLTLSGCR